MPTSKSSLLKSARSLVDKMIPVYGTARRITAIIFLKEKSSTANGGLWESYELNAGSMRGTEIVCGPIPKR